MSTESDSPQLELFDPDEDGLDFGAWMLSLSPSPSRSWRHPNSREARQEREQDMTERLARRIRRLKKAGQL